LRTLLKEKEEHNGTWGFGANPSPARAYLTGYTALFLGQPALAAANLEKALLSGCYRVTEAQLKSDLARAKTSSH